VLYPYLARFSALGFLCLLAACGSFFPSFEGPFGLGSWIHDMPVKTVATRIQCELKEFLIATQGYDFFDPEQPAALSLNMQTDNAGKVSYLGIDLKRLGPLAPLADLVTAQNKIPTLQASGQIKSTISSQIDFTIPQTIKSLPVKPVPTYDPVMNQWKYNKPSTIIGLETIPCEPQTSVFRFYLKEWLFRFFDNLRTQEGNTGAACMTKVTLKTAFQIVVDVNGGLTPLFPATFILPVNGYNFDYNPAFTHSLNIVFALKKHEGSFCTSIPPPSPNRTI
jgi:hypothetical protein